ncbi:DUF6985 domain-containing protein [Psychrobacillus lasiicapitis]|uniref:DUF6985 domain-containing protein n=1 Tax=Psychrobacillus lasiicapitis TaxID=1636719 RepID=A0A544SZX0_9BACI|nr:hypothetical protein [Psychrobacillus lasiicapitis]TQR10737.1 hypothetical protein FG382_16895 [Psychrobacillus lasiicapitis]GGA42885.1 hypothetical protein GCM10011384_35820 [Psychrobacillus lasiicapitis]
MVIKNLKTNEYSELEGEAYLELFNQTIKVYIDQDSDIEYAELCITDLNNLNEELIVSLCEASIRYCNEFLDDIGEEMIKFSKPKDVLAHITLNTICIPNPKNKAEAVIDLELNCTWEEEHGMEWIIRNGEVRYVGPYNGINPYGNCDIGEDWNYVEVNNV